MKSWSAKWIISKNTIHRNAEIILDKGVISEIRPCDSPQYEYICPMLFDIHINGGYNFHFTAQPDVQTIADINDASFAFGTFYTLPTIITSPTENILRGVQDVKKYINANPDKGVLGIHIEGAFLNPLKKGAHLEKYISRPTKEIIDTIWEEGRDVIKLWTISPEMFSEDVLDYLLSTGLNLSIGHSNATYEEAMDAMGKGVKLVTHLYNAMSPLTHRAPGLVGAALTSNDIYAQIILDGLHCHPAAASLALQIKKDKSILVSDALFLGRKKQSFQWEAFDARLVNRTYYNKEGNLAGSAISQLDAVKFAISELQTDPLEALKMASINPFMALNIKEEKWDITSGNAVPFIGLDKDMNFSYHLLV
jgi:N-acetylglucosamine-6-phosphate deacetylase